MKIWLIIFLVQMVSHRVRSQLRLVVNTTCLELAKPSNQQLRLTCSQYDYHCLLDETFTKEFEACREWKWIPGGKCAYFNTYGRGNIDERNCVPKNNLTCSHRTGTFQFSSAENTEYTACYVKKEISTSLPVTTSPTGTQSDGENATSVSTSSNKKYERSGHALLIILPIILGIIAPFVSLAVIYFIFMHLKYVQNTEYRKAYPTNRQKPSDIVRNEDIVEQQPFLMNKVEDSPESPSTIKHEDEIIIEGKTNDEDIVEKQPFLTNKVEDSPESPSTIKHEDEIIIEAKTNDEDIVEKQPVLRIKVEGASTSKSPPTMRQDDGNIAEARRSGNSDANYPADMNESDLSDQFEDAPTSPTIIKQRNSEVSTDNSDNEDGVTQERTDVFDDTVQSLQRIAHPTDEQDIELCTELYSLLDTEGLKLTQEVMAATITRLTGKSVKTLTDQEKSKLKAILLEEFHHFLESKTEHDTSFHVSYGLHRIILDEEKSPKSGWGNPVRETDTSIGDDVERLYRIQTIVREMSNPVTVSVEDYIRLLDIMIEALTRLDPGAEFKEDYKLLLYKLESIKNPNLTQTMLKAMTNIVKKIW